MLTSILSLNFDFDNNLDDYTLYKIIIPKYKRISVEFIKFIEQTNVDEILLGKYKTLIEELYRIYPHLNTLNFNPLINVSKYSVSDWGPVYWKFFHYTSILLQYATFKLYTNKLFDFPLLLYNIDSILPCVICTNHYLSLKKTPIIDMLIQSLSYGYIVESVYFFHKTITQSIKQYNGDSNDALPFTPIDFMLEYNTIMFNFNKPKIQHDFTYIPTRFVSQAYATVLATLSFVTSNKIRIQTYDYLILKIFNVQEYSTYSDYENTSLTGDESEYVRYVLNNLKTNYIKTQNDFENYVKLVMHALKTSTSFIDMLIKIQDNIDNIPRQLKYLFERDAKNQLHPVELDLFNRLKLQTNENNIFS